MEYVDFEVEIRAAQDGTHPVVVRSPAGEARGTLNLPLNPVELQSRLKDVQIALLRSGPTRRRIVSAEEGAVRAFGQELFGALFHDEILSRFDGSRLDARRDHKGVRIKLRFESPELAALPWEYLFDPRHDDYVSRSMRTPLVRYLELSEPVDPLRVTPPLRILGLVASPSDLEPLDVAHEQGRVGDALAELVEEGRLEIHWMQDATPEGLQRELERSAWHILHFVGHGGYDTAAEEGVILLLDEVGNSRRLAASQLARLLGDHQSMRLAVLNSCEGARGSTDDTFSSTAASILRRGTPAVVAMQDAISDVAAINFSRTFYTSIASGLSVDAAVSQARLGIWLAEPASVEWGTPVLYMHAQDGRLFDLPTSSAGPSVPVLKPPEAGTADPISTVAAASGRLLNAVRQGVQASLDNRSAAAVPRTGAPVAANPVAVPPDAVVPAARPPTAVAQVAEVPATAMAHTPAKPVAPAPARTFCIYCAVKIIPGNRFCTGCGRSVD